MLDSRSKRPVDQGWALTLPVVLGPLMLLPLSGDAVDAPVSYMTLLANGLVFIKNDIAVRALGAVHEGGEGGNAR